jgi:cytochrome c biogenesis protein
MSALEETITSRQITASARERRGPSVLTRGLKLLSSVRFGVTLLVLLGLACLIGMLIMQENVDGFSNYYQTLTPAQRLVYGKLDLFDIYHAWYFNALLAVLSLNIVLSSIERFPKTWELAAKPNVTVPIRWLNEQAQTAAMQVQGSPADAALRVETAFKEAGWRRITRTEKNGRLFVFGQSGVWNRFGAYPVHVALLTIFFGGFLTGEFGTTGQLPLAPGQSSDLISENVVQLERVDQVTKQLPFEVTFTDIQQKLLKKEGPITASNTIDWITRFTLKDEYGTHEAMVQMNRPYDYRGYRFFQASFVSIGRARNIVVRLTPADGGPSQDISIPRDGTVSLADGTKIRFAEFRGNFRIGPENLNDDTSAYPNPGAILQVTPPAGTVTDAYAFGPQMINLPVAKKPVAGYTYQLVDFEKVSDQHILSVQRDPGATVVYVGFSLLVLTLGAVFFFSHQRVWAVVESETDGVSNVTVAGNTNRNQNGFDEKFKRFIENFKVKTAEGRI